MFADFSNILDTEQYFSNESFAALMSLLADIHSIQKVTRRMGAELATAEEILQQQRRSK